MKVCLNCWCGITILKKGFSGTNPRVINTNAGKYYCSMCDDKSNGYVEIEVPEGCLVVSSRDVEIKD